jgi:hypothetical protein
VEFYILFVWIETVVGQDFAYTVNIEFRESVENLESIATVSVTGRILGAATLITPQRNICWKRVFLFLRQSCQTKKNPRKVTDLKYPVSLHRH